MQAMRSKRGFTPTNEEQSGCSHTFCPTAAGVKPRSGFTLIELLVVIAIIGLLASVVMASLNSARDKGRIAASVQTQRQMERALALYYDDMGFYPPDVGRGWDPGLAKALPYNPDAGVDCNLTPGSCGACAHCPSDWVAQAQARWRGPYLSVWPGATPWGGEYDYNYWGTGAGRYGCTVPAGMYIGVQGDYSNANTIPAASEQQMLNQGLDSDGCLDGESQMLLLKL
ncbi:type II secretion system protein [Candidatus Kaiserbacteria bacterium]|nr:type II secretion system protein [Candidatus Kaiserbacteria bacterium]